MNVEGQNYGDRSILTFVFLYSIGRFVKVHENYVVEKAPKLVRNPWAIYSTLMFFFFVLVSFLPSFLPRGINFFAHAYNTIGLTLFSVIFLYCFKTLKIQKRWINAFAKSTFAIYLIHGNNIVTYHRWIYDPYTRYGITIDNMHLRLFYLLCSALAICFACIIIDQLRILLFKFLGIDWIIMKLDWLANRKLQFVTNNSFGNGTKKI